MNSEIVLSVKDLLLFVLWGMLVIVFTYLILILARAFKIVKTVNKVVDDNKPQIDQTLNVIPDLAKNVEIITGEFAHDVAAFRGTVDNVAETSESITETIKDNQGVMEGLASFMHTVAIGKALYDNFFGNKMEIVKDAVKQAEEIINSKE